MKKIIHFVVLAGVGELGAHEEFHDEDKNAARLAAVTWLSDRQEELRPRLIRCNKWTAYPDVAEALEYAGLDEAFGMLEFVLQKCLGLAVVEFSAPIDTQ